MNIEEIRSKLLEVEIEAERNMVEDNWHNDNGGMEESELEVIDAKLDHFKEVLKLLEEHSDPLYIAQQLSI